MIADPLFIGSFVISLVFSLAVSLLFYIFRSLGLYAIAKRRQINKPWLAWIPVGNQWILGSISDQYQYVAKGKNKSKRKIMLALSVILYALYALFVAAYVFLIISLVKAAGTEEFTTQMIGPMVTIATLALPMCGIAIAMMVFRYMATYDLYSSCNPQNSTLFLVLSIIFSVTEPFFVFACRNMEAGMPPRKTVQPQYIPPVEETSAHTQRTEQDPWEN